MSTNPSGLKEQEIIDISIELSRMKADKNTFGHYDIDDISQEIWIATHKAASAFDASRLKSGKRPLSFFNVVSENALRNLKRDNRRCDNVNVGDTPIEQADSSLEGELRASELYDFILARLPDNLHESLVRLVFYGGEGVSQYIKTKIRTLVLKILQEYYE